MKLTLLAVLGAGFAGIALMQFAGAASSSDAHATAVPNLPPSSVPSPSNDAANEPQQCFTSEMAALLGDRETRILERETALDQREAELQTLEEALGNRMAAVEAGQEKLGALVSRLDATSGEDIEHLVTMYSAMKPKKAAEIFDRMDPAFAAGFIREMDSMRAGLILAEMKADNSYKISLLIANRSASWRNSRSQ